MRNWFSRKPVNWINEARFEHHLNPNPIEGLVHKFVKTGNIEFVNMLVENRVNVNQQFCRERESKRSPLHLASDLESLEMILCLLRNGANPFQHCKCEACNADPWWRPIPYHNCYYAAGRRHALQPKVFFGDERVILAALGTVENIIEVDARLGRVLLCVAAQQGIASVVGSLLNIPSEMLSSAKDLREHDFDEFDHKTQQSVCEMILELVRRRSEIIVISSLLKYGDARLLLSIRANMWSIARLLIEPGEDLEICGRGFAEGGHAFYFAILEDGMPILDYLILHGPKM